MKQICRFFAITVIMTLLSGCSTLKVSQDYDASYDFSGLKTFAWQDAVQPKTGDARVDSPLIDQRIRMAVEENLAGKGIAPAQNNPPDFTVAYTNTISTKLQSTPVSTGVGIGYGGRGSIGGIGVSTGSEIRQYDQGLLIIDFLAPDSGKLLWRGTSTRVVNIHASPQESTKNLDTTVEKLLAQFPPQ